MHRPAVAVTFGAAAAGLFVALAVAPGSAGAATSVPGVSSSSRYAITSTVTVGRDPLKAAVDPVTHRVFVTNDVDGTVSVIDGRTDRVAKTITTPGSPNWIAIDARIGRAWFSNEQGAEVGAIDTTTEHYLGAVTTSDGTSLGSGSGTEGVAIDPKKSLVYSSDGYANAGQTSAVSEASMSLIRDNVAVTDDPGPTGSRPQGMAFDAGRGLLFTANIGNDTLSVIKASSGVPSHVIDLQPYGADPEAVYYEASTNRIFVAMWSRAGTTGEDAVNGQVLVLDGSTFKKVGAIKTDGDPSDIAADPTDHAIFVPNQTYGGNNLGAPGSLLVIDDRTLKLEQRVLTPSASQSEGVAVDPETHTVYVVNTAATTDAPGTVAVVNLVIDSGPGTIAFGSSTASTTAGSTATISVVRAGDTSSASSVRYATSNGTGHAGRDYVKAEGTVHFPKGARVATFGVRTIGTKTTSASLKVHLSLSDVVGGALKKPHTATLTIAERAAPRLTSVPADRTINTRTKYHAVFAAAARPAATFTVSSGALPAGLALNHKTGAVSGKSRVGGTFTYRVTASNGIKPASTTGVVTLTVYKPPTFTQDTPPTSLPVNENWNGYVFKVDEYPSDSDFTVSSGSLPTGMTMNSGYLFGVPTAAGTYTFKITATNPEIGPPATTPTITMTITS